MAYISLSDLKKALGSSNAGNFADAQLTDIINSNNAKINTELNVKVVREFVMYINDAKTNYVDGINDTFYVRNWFGKYFGDSNNDGLIGIEDVKVIQRDSLGAETVLTVSSIDGDDMGVTLSSAPESGVSLYITYCYSYFDMNSPDQNIKDLMKFLCLKDCFFDLEIDLIGTSAKSGNISISGLEKNSKTAKYDKRANDLLNSIKKNILSKESVVPIIEANKNRYRREEYLSIPNKPYNDGSWRSAYYGGW